MTEDNVKVVLLGIAQDGGVPQCGCSCERCLAVLNGKAPELFPVALGVTDKEGKFHLVEASRTLSRQLFLWGKALQKTGQNIDVVKNISSVSLTHLHLGHVDGLGLFGREVMGCGNGSVKLIASNPVLKELDSRSLLTPFAPVSIKDGDNVELGPGVKIEFHRVPHREEEGFDTHAIVVRSEKKSLLFLPDHDTYTETLQWKQVDSIRAWFKKLDVDIVLIDGTFFTKDEVAIRREDACSIPHPSIEESLNLLGQRQADDPEIFFIHLNHTNSIIDDRAKQAEVTKLGWGIGQQGQLFII